MDDNFFLLSIVDLQPQHSKKLENFQRYNLCFCIILLGSVNSVFGLFSLDKSVYLG